ncbi:response regulator [Zoogloea sp.]|uniref:response regulator n=1 Tax=Zoogloea sp. TaxID=49181 RepID=UPI0025E2A1CA|nr:response regulator [Zoogloea sp.]MCK6395521.1 response regulator [Zoogloea sp.]
MKVLIVDDQKVNRTLPSVLLRQLGCEVIEADSGEAALVALRGQSMDAILLDISMPGISGTEVCQRLRGDPALAGLYIVAYTAHALPEQRVEMLAAGFDEVLIKPINRQRLLEALRLPL